jgi:Holliday junction resolvase-like predicted endonuclease
MTQQRRSLGAEGETRAAAHLLQRGFHIAARNVRAGGVELDLVAVRGRLVVFVEVKAPRCFQRARFDVIACERDGGGRWRIRHLEGAFDADG